MAKLTVAAVRAAKHPGTSARPVRTGDGGGCILQIAAGGSKSWLFRYTLAGKAEEQPRTFQEVTGLFLATQSARWHDARAQTHWRASLDRHAGPHLYSMLVAGIGTTDVLKVLQPIWHTKPRAAAQLRSRIEAVLDYASALERRGRENPARWRGHIAKLLPPREKVSRVRHHPALPWAIV